MEMTTESAFLIIGIISVCLGLVTLFWGDD